uniref:Plastid lipid-associated protein/fibrillin conserved domain-containing protein n=1 Tax=Cryptomonas curvata TaxID=233186 RepID=A0A7S0LVG1_9CRYP|mmetsp:Transcript_11858/g.25463  ORF Transcript_11858/g.25463 Transcript_11858/m.25463 type:complete len:257 (+) Transcript_11858:25-795(+)
MALSTPKLPVLVLLVQAFVLQKSEAFSVKPISVLGLSKISTRPQCSQRFLLSCALKSFGPKISSSQLEPRISSSQAQHQRAIFLDRRSALGSLAAAIALRLQPAGAVENSSASTTKTTPSEKLFRLSNDKLKAMVESDIRDRQFLVTGQLTRSIYDESCTFTDEIDTYTLDKWIQGTQLLFSNAYSHVDLDGPITVSDAAVELRFKERLMFNLPILQPKVPLSGKLTLKRGGDGLIVSYREEWDSPVWKVLLSATF